MSERQSLPLVTIGLPVYNAALFLEDALRSIFSQTYSSWELVIVDDGSTDESRTVVSKLRDERVRFLFDGQHMGLASRLNDVMRVARGKYIARMDADDLMHPARLQTQLDFLLSHPGVDGVGCGLVIVDRTVEPVGILQYPADHQTICTNMLRGALIAHATFVAKTEWLQSHPYNEHNHSCEDWELWQRTHSFSHFANLREPLYFYREFQTFSLRKYLFRKTDYVRTVWRHRCPYGTLRTSAACAGHILRIPVYALCTALRLQDYLIRARSRRITPQEARTFRTVIGDIRGKTLPQ